MGDIRNKLAKIERAAAEQKAFASFMRAGAQCRDIVPAERRVSDEQLDRELLSQPLPTKAKTRSFRPGSGR